MKMMVAPTLVLCSGAFGASILPGDLFIQRVGVPGSAYTSGQSAQVFVDEYTRSGVLVQTFNVTQQLLTAGFNYTNSISSRSEGHLNLSTDGKYLTLIGYNAPVGVGSIASTIAGAGANQFLRAVATVDGSNGTISGFTVGNNGLNSNNAWSGDNPRSAIRDSNGQYWGSGNANTPGSTGGVWSFRAPASGTAATNVTQQTQSGSTNTRNTRNIEIFNGQLYVTTSNATFIGLDKVGTGTPTANTNQTMTRIINPGSTASPIGFSISPDGNTIYMADDRTGGGGGIQKWTMSGSSFTLAYTLSAGLNFLLSDLNPLMVATESGVRGLYVDWTGANPEMWATTPLVSTGSRIRAPARYSANW
jgi:hypothetical protein